MNKKLRHVFLRNRLNLNVETPSISIFIRMLHSMWPLELAKQQIYLVTIHSVLYFYFHNFVFVQKFMHSSTFQMHILMVRLVFFFLSLLLSHFCTHTRTHLCRCAFNNFANKIQLWTIMRMRVFFFSKMTLFSLFFSGITFELSLLLNQNVFNVFQVVANTYVYCVRWYISI